MILFADLFGVALAALGMIFSIAHSMPKHFIGAVRMMFIFGAVFGAFGLCIMYMRVINPTNNHTTGCQNAYRQLFMRMFGGTVAARIEYLLDSLVSYIPEEYDLTQAIVIPVATADGGCPAQASWWIRQRQLITPAPGNETKASQHSKLNTIRQVFIKFPLLYFFSIGPRFMISDRRLEREAAAAWIENDDDSAFTKYHTLKFFYALELFNRMINGWELFVLEQNKEVEQDPEFKLWQAFRHRETCGICFGRLLDGKITRGRYARRPRH